MQRISETLGRMLRARSPATGGRQELSIARGYSPSSSRPPSADNGASGRRAERVSEAPNQKASRVGPLIAYDTLGQPVWSPRDYSAFAREGFMQNAIVYRSVRMIAEAAASIPLLLYAGNDEIEQHPLLDLMRQPSLDHTGADFLEAWYGFLLVAGNAYVEAVAVDGEIRELHNLRPDRMKVLAGQDGWPEGYEYTAGGRSVRFVEEPVEGVRPIFHTRLFHPANDHYGMSPIEAAATAIDIHNTASGWNKALLDNSARPSGALVYAASNGQMTDEQFSRLKSELETSFQGAAHAGRPLLLEGGLDWKPLSMTPKDMDFVEAKNSAAREIALAIGVPPMLLGIPGDNTYSNYAEAQRAFWRQTVLPLVNRMAQGFSSWLAPCDSRSASRPQGAELMIKPDLDAVEALAPEREALWARLNAATFLTDDEKRAAAGYAAKGDVGRFEKYRDDQPRVPAGNSDGGRWTSGSEQTGRGGGGGDRAQPKFDDKILVAQAGESEKFQVNLADEAARGGHTHTEHVAKSPELLVAHVRQETAKFIAQGVSATRIRAGTYPSIEAATKLTNATLAQNLDKVARVASGNVKKDFIVGVFSSATGVEAYARNVREQPRIRVTTGVGISIVHDPRSKTGFTVISSYPRNDD